MPVPEREALIVPNRRLLTDDVFDRLSDDIIRGRLEPGQRVHDVALAGELGLSRATVRTAILRLTHIGLVESVPNLYTRVAPLSLRYYLEADDTARALYLMAVRYGTPLLTDPQIAGMQAWVASLAGRDEVDTESIFTGAATAGLFQPFVDSLDNAPLERTLARLRPHLLRVLGQFGHLVPREVTNPALNDAIACAAQHDVEGTVAAFHRYYDEGMAVFHERLAREPAFVHG